jgi:drug/metabolite transporter (DMT)-like permease
VSLNDVVVLLAVALLGTSQVLQKLGATRRLSGRRAPKEWAAALLSVEILGAVFCILAGTALWLLVLYRMDVSRAFPFLSLTSVVVVAASRVLLAERVPLHRWLGVALIAAGIGLVAST